MLLDEVGELEEEAAALGGVHVAPGLEGAAGGLDGDVHVGLVGLLDLGDDLARGRVDGLEGLAREGVDPLAVDQELGGAWPSVSGAGSEEEAAGGGTCPCSGTCVRQPWRRRRSKTSAGRRSFALKAEAFIRPPRKGSPNGSPPMHAGGAARTLTAPIALHTA